jgi:hypothetical protein
MFMCSTGSKATAAAYTKALSTKGSHVVDSGHAAESLVGGKKVAGSVHLANDQNVGVLGTGRTTIEVTPHGATTTTDPVPVGNVQASTVGVFTCNSTDLRGQYSGTTFTGIDSGHDRDTSIGALDAAAVAYTNVLASGGTLDSATDAATKALPADNYGYATEDVKQENYKNLQDGDHAVTTPKKKDN